MLLLFSKKNIYLYQNIIHKNYEKKTKYQYIIHTRIYIIDIQNHTDVYIHRYTHTHTQTYIVAY